VRGPIVSEAQGEYGERGTRTYTSERLEGLDEEGVARWA
jgi:hypothetical protein